MSFAANVANTRKLSVGHCTACFKITELRFCYELETFMNLIN